MPCLVLSKSSSSSAMLMSASHYQHTHQTKCEAFLDELDPCQCTTPCQAGRFHSVTASRGARAPAPHLGCEEMLALPNAMLWDVASMHSQDVAALQGLLLPKLLDLHRLTTWLALQQLQHQAEAELQGVCRTRPAERPRTTKSNTWGACSVSFWAGLPWWHTDAGPSSAGCKVSGGPPPSPGPADLAPGLPLPLLPSAQHPAGNSRLDVQCMHSAAPYLLLVS